MVWVREALAFAIYTKTMFFINSLLSSRMLLIGMVIDKSCTGLQLTVLIGDVKTAKIFIKHGTNVNKLSCEC